MSPIIDVQYRLRELGRLRMGVKGKQGMPQRLDTWRLTCASKELLDAAAEVYGGTVKIWEDAPNEGDHFELITDSETIDIIIPPNEAAFSQWMELWTGGGCKKRCDGHRQVLRDVACSCPSDLSERIEAAKKGKACKPVTRFNIMLPKLPDIGVWRLESHGYNAARELAGFARITEIATQAGQMIVAKLRIDHRTSKRPGEKPHRFVVPVLEISETLGEMFRALGIIGPAGMTAPVEPRSLPGGQPNLPSDPTFDFEVAEDPDSDWSAGSVVETADPTASRPTHPETDAAPPTTASTGAESPGAPSASAPVAADLWDRIDQAVTSGLFRKNVVALKAKRIALGADTPIPENYEDIGKLRPDLLQALAEDLKLDERVPA